MTRSTEMWQKLPWSSIIWFILYCLPVIVFRRGHAGWARWAMGASQDNEQKFSLPYFLWLATSFFKSQACLLVETEEYHFSSVHWGSLFCSLILHGLSTILMLMRPTKNMCFTFASEGESISKHGVGCVCSSRDHNCVSQYPLVKISGGCLARSLSLSRSLSLCYLLLKIPASSFPPFLPLSSHAGFTGFRKTPRRLAPMSMLPQK